MACWRNLMACAWAAICLLCWPDVLKHLCGHFGQRTRACTTRCEQGFSASTHVQRLDRQPQRLDTNHRNHSRSHVPQAAASCTGQPTETLLGPRRNSMRMSATGAGPAPTLTGTNLPAPAAVISSQQAPAARARPTPVAQRCVWIYQRRSKLSFRPYDSATDAIDTPGRQHTCATCALNSALCRHRPRRACPAPSMDPSNRCSSRVCAALPMQLYSSPNAAITAGSNRLRPSTTTGVSRAAAFASAISAACANLPTPPGLHEHVLSLTCVGEPSRQ